MNVTYNPTPSQYYQNLPKPQVPNYGYTTSVPDYLQPTTGTPQQLPFIEQSYIENILRLNRGKVATVYMNFENKTFGSKAYKGVIEAAGRDHLILSDPTTGIRYLLLTIFINFITFDEEINYEYPYAPTSQVLGTAAPIFNLPPR